MARVKDEGDDELQDDDREDWEKESLPTPKKHKPS